MFKAIILMSSVVAILAEQRRAGVTLTSKEGVKGNVVFTQTTEGVKIEGQITGLEPGKHGFHVHALGDLSNGCASTSGHFNPHNTTHGAPDAKTRHVGDLGNIDADNKGTANINFMDSIISLGGEHCIIGRAVVVHSGEDDLGLGGHSDSLTTGHAGDRVACGVIGILTPDAWHSDKSHGSGAAATAIVTSVAASAILIISTYSLG